jgi:SAM-dependent methyltransferase
MRLGFCRQCGHTFNVAFNPDLMKYYDRDYENSLHYSPRFQEYANSLAASLIARYDLHDKNIIEIGCGRGDFLVLLCELGGNRGVGFDPSYTLKRATDVGQERITFVQDFYSERYADYKADLICCRQVLEHIHRPRDFLSTIRRAIDGWFETAVFFEVPNVNFMLRGLSIWDLIYEHCSYFSAGSLARLFDFCGFAVRNCAEGFEGQFLSIEALPIKDSTASQSGQRDGLEQLARDVAAFAGRYQSKVSAWRLELEKIASAGKRAVVWGAGSKGVTFLNIFQNSHRIEYIVDINPIKQGKYIAGTGQKIVSPEILLDYRPDIVIVMNPIYFEEIGQHMQKMGLSPKLVSA